jgi:putative acetyltransferase
MSLPDVQIRNLDPADPAALRLIEASDEYMAALYPAESIHSESASALGRPGTSFFGTYVGQELAGCAAAKVRGDDGTYGEIKRLFVAERYRGKGLAKTLVQHIEAHLAASGIQIVRLEAGIRQPEALGLYRSLGYVERDAFGGYAPDPLSVFMEKRL